MNCGYCGCARYEGGHSLKHFLETGHNFSLEAREKHIWSYITDNFVHRVPDKPRLGSTRWEADEQIGYGHNQGFGNLDGSGLQGTRRVNTEELLEANLSARLLDMLDRQRMFYESKIEHKKDAVQRDISESKDKDFQAYVEQKEQITREMNELKAAINKEKKKKLSLEHKIKRITNDITEEKATKEMLEGHIKGIEVETDDSVCNQLDNDIKLQLKLLEGFDAKLVQMYEQFAQNQN